VAASLSQMVFHGLSAKVQESRHKRRTPSHVSSESEIDHVQRASREQRVRNIRENVVVRG
jgi:hypothetical protein